MSARKARPNPFYVALLIASTLFTITALGYLVGPFVEQQALEHPRGGPGPGSKALAAWLDQWGATLLAIEFVVMFITGLLAMATDHLFSPAPLARKAQPETPRKGAGRP
ncbi:MAG: hypothetical protein IRY99_01455 [Isosphaeraceae bacterium]|nr:hypothetical protein [Isosphaeraceae bacterium]